MIIFRLYRRLGFLNLGLFNNLIGLVEQGKLQLIWAARGMRIVQIGGKYKATRPDRRVDYISLPLSLLDNGTRWHQIATWFHSEK